MTIIFPNEENKSIALSQAQIENFHNNSAKNYNDIPSVIGDVKNNRRGNTLWKSGILSFEGKEHRFKITQQFFGRGRLINSDLEIYFSDTDYGNKIQQQKKYISNEDGSFSVKTTTNYVNEKGENLYSNVQSIEQFDKNKILTPREILKEKFNQLHEQSLKDFNSKDLLKIKVSTSTRYNFRGEPLPKMSRLPVSRVVQTGTMMVDGEEHSITFETKYNISTHRLEKTKTTIYANNSDAKLEQVKEFSYLNNGSKGVIIKTFLFDENSTYHPLKNEFTRQNLSKFDESNNWLSTEEFSRRRPLQGGGRSKRSVMPETLLASEAEADEIAPYKGSLHMECNVKNTLSEAMGAFFFNKESIAYSTDNILQQGLASIVTPDIAN